MKRKMITVSTALALMLSVAGCKDKAPDTGDPTTRGAENTSAALYTPEDTETHSNIIEESVTENTTDPTSSTQSNAQYLLLGFTGQPMFIPIPSIRIGCRSGNRVDLHYHIVRTEGCHVTILIAADIDTGICYDPRKFIWVHFQTCKLILMAIQIRQTSISSEIQTIQLIIGAV